MYFTVKCKITVTQLLSHKYLILKIGLHVMCLPAPAWFEILGLAFFLKYLGSPATSYLAANTCYILATVNTSRSTQK